ncbi:urea ABC transporter substrate-binding protein [Aliikangiella sp. G2MR2-5]|uniref:urea ABC transporter substrate-binding protein n=1 Tax=Aliikangiella sp. G2MR2-5 TaxID=2788943 RepID=UPI0018A96C45|nr:urea ABC transporter substrate-binding protein [Aliikangiella sp. G2MR2-5]
MKSNIKQGLFFLLIAVVMISLIFIIVSYFHRPAIKIGVMHSLSGTMAVSEKGVVDAVLLAVDEINQQGGLMGRKIKAVVRDGESSPRIFTEIAKALIEKDEVEAIFGCWTSSCRKAVLPVIEKNNHLLYYPLQYEGMELSKNVIYLGEVPNQQVLPALEWTFSEIGKRIYLIGSDYIYPRATNQVIKDQVEKWRGEIVGESYVPLGEKNFSSVVEDIRRVMPDAIFNTINGDSNLSFFKALRESNIYPKSVPTFSFSIAEDELSLFADVDMDGDFLVWNYLSDSNNHINQEFKKRFTEKYGAMSRIGNPMVTAYLGVHLWAKAVRMARTSEVEEVLKYTSDISIQGPGGMIYVEKNTHHTWKPIHIAQIDKNKQLRSVWFSKVPIAPQPFPQSRSEKEWKAFVDEF